MPQLDTILQSVFQLHKLKITYQKINQEVSARTIRPYGIVIKEMIWYLIGYCESSFTIRMFRCDRIMDCTRLEDTFIYPKNFELKSYFKDAMKGFQQKCALEEQYLVTMVVNEKTFCYLKGMEYSIVWHEKDRWKICINLYGFENAQNDYWNIIMNATCIEPPELRKALYKKLSAHLEDMQ
ncbi:MAG: WYL domain-containing protein [Lachnospiraceae bacterium]|nr:WYL domain-containing protein [Lachnospiraceae bacterium]